MEDHNALDRFNSFLPGNNKTEHLIFSFEGVLSGAAFSQLFLLHNTPTISFWFVLQTTYIPGCVTSLCCSQAVDECEAKRNFFSVK